MISTVVAAAIAAISLILLAQGERFNASWVWLRFGEFTLSMGIKFDDLAALMLAIVGVVGFCVHLFSLGYMHEDGAKARYFGGLSIFMFSMIGIVLADNLFMIFVFWELVGFSSYLLINHFLDKQSAAEAAKKAFIVNRVGDFGFLLGIIACYWANGTVNFNQLGEFGVAGKLAENTAVPLLLFFCGAVGKSAQMPLHVWLPDAMEGPTPVSALIHAATMVAAGIYMLCRINVLMVPVALKVIAAVGTTTALYAALCAVVQSDIKKVLAYSTLSQLGYMVAAFGLGSITICHEMGGTAHEILVASGVGAAMFHLTTHAFSKALLFLGSGSVIYSCCHEQDIFKMGGLRAKMPLTFFAFTLGVLSIIGFPFFSGFFSKDAIFCLAFKKNKAIFVILALAATFTAFYMIRMWKTIFFDAPRSYGASHAHEGRISMTLPLAILAIFVLICGYSGVFSRLAGSVAELVPEVERDAQTTISAVSLLVLILGAGSAWLFYEGKSVDTLKIKAPCAFKGLVGLKESFDFAYNYYVAKVQQRLAMLLNFFEQIFLAGLVVRGVAGFVGLIGLLVRALHVGNLQVYVYWFFLGAGVLWGFAMGGA